MYTSEEGIVICKVMGTSWDFKWDHSNMEV